MNKAQGIRDRLSVFYFVMVPLLFFAGIAALEFGVIALYIAGGLGFAFMFFTVLYLLINILATLEEIRDGKMQRAITSEEQGADSSKKNPYPLGKPIYVIDPPTN